MEETIFIQIAAYRDPELIPTLRDLFSKAQFPDQLKVCIAWQHAKDDTLEEFETDPRVHVIKIDYRESKGACWARNLIQQEYNKETYTLQLDSHHRFIQNWDTELIGMYKDLQNQGVKKPLLTSYIPSYDPDNDPAGRVRVPWRMDFDRFIPEGAIFFLPATIENHESLKSPVPSRFYSAHFCFTSGSFCLEVPHDPQYYFHGEEISVAVRAFTHGYDLYHPHKIIAWHEYTRKNRTKHWDDHVSQKRDELADKKDWWERNTECHKRNRCLFSMDGERYESIEWGRYGFGTIRTLRDYEKYAGIHFGKRAIQAATIKREYPSSQLQEKYKNDTEWEASFLSIFKHCIDLQTEQFTEDDYDFWCVAFEREDGTSLYRKDVSELESKQLINDAKNSKQDRYIKLWREFTTEEKPHHWIVWPHSKAKGWGNKIEGKL